MRDSPAIAASARRWLRPERPGCAPATSRFAPTVRAGLVELDVAAALDVALAGRRPREAEDHAQRRRLARAVRTEEAGHRAIAHRKVRSSTATRRVAFREADGLDGRGALIGARTLPERPAVRHFARPAASNRVSPVLAGRAPVWRCGPMLLEGRKLLVTGVLTESSIAFSIARRAQEEGAELVLTGFGRGLRITQRVARRLPTEPDVLELDVNDSAQLEAVGGGARQALGPPRRPRPRDRVRPRRRAGRQLPDRAERVGARRVRDERVLDEGARGGAAAAARARRGAGRRDRRASTSTRRSRGPRTTGPACRRPRSSRSTATSRATSGRAACARTSSRRAR